MLHMFASAGVLTTLTRGSFPSGSATSKALHADALINLINHRQKQNFGLSLSAKSHVKSEILVHRYC